MFPGIAIATRRTAALAAVHAAALFAADGGGEAGCSGSRARAAAGGVGEDVGLHALSARLCQIAEGAIGRALTL